METLTVNLLTASLGEETILLRTLVGALSWGGGAGGWVQGAAAAGDVPGPVADLHRGVVERALLAGVQEPLPSNTLTEGVFTITLSEISIFCALMSITGKDGLRGESGHGHRGGVGDKDVGEHKGCKKDVPHLEVCAAQEIQRTFRT